jgi:hypothetical protein
MDKDARLTGRQRLKVENVDETQLASPAMPNVCIWRYRVGAS